MKNDLRRAIERSPRSKSWPKGLEAPCNENGETIQMGASEVALSERREDETEDIHYFVDILGRTAMEGPVIVYGTVSGRGGSGANSYSVKSYIENPRTLFSTGRLSYVETLNVEHCERFDESDALANQLGRIRNEFTESRHCRYPTVIRGNQLFVNETPRAK